MDIGQGNWQPEGCVGGLRDTGRRWGRCMQRTARQIWETMLVSRSSIRHTPTVHLESGPLLSTCSAHLGSGLTHSLLVCLNRVVTGWARAVMTTVAGLAVPEASRPLPGTPRASTHLPLGGQSPKISMLATSNIDAIVGTYLYYKSLIILKFKCNWHLVFLLATSDNSTQVQGSLGGQTQWPAPTNTVTAPAAACPEGRPVWQAGELAPRQRTSPQGHARWCVATLPPGGRVEEGAPPGPAPHDPTALLLPPHSLRPF